MRIKQLELVGFKSFPQRTVLDFPSGVTGVVGPNGCGKSNIVDAIRWVLGEQSPKHLRGDAMEAVVFNGNENLSPLGMAEVSLTFDNDRPLGPPTDLDLEVSTLPAHIRELPEITVSRRYFRSGESEYLINRMPCRLKDITELFLGTGVGSKAYAIIEQGRVEQLINAKPEDRRLFIEEAAGTTLYRARKQAAERKMERTRENLSRVNDILHEIDRQTQYLERQAKKAEVHKRLVEELRGLEVRVSGRQYQVLQRELVALDETRDRLAADADRLRAELERINRHTRRPPPRSPTRSIAMPRRASSSRCSRPKGTACSSASPCSRSSAPSASAATSGSARTPKRRASRRRRATSACGRPSASARRRRSTSPSTRASCARRRKR
jgi:chromosome segregation protein